MAQAEIDRLFPGTINRGLDVDGTPVVFGKIKANNGFICGQTSDQWILGDMMDEMVLMVLDYDIHKIPDYDFIVSSN